MGSRVVHAEDDGGGSLYAGLLAVVEDGDWICSCGNSRIESTAGTDRINVYGVMWLRLGQTLVCKDCGDTCRISPTINFIGTRDQRPTGTVAEIIDDDEDEMLWEDDEDDDDVSWD